MNINTIEKENLQSERTIVEMKTEIMRESKDFFEEIAKHLKDTFKQVIHQIDYVYDVTKRTNQRIDKLEVNLDKFKTHLDKLEVHLHKFKIHLDKLEVHQPDTGIVWLIKKGISMLGQIAFNFFLGPIAGYIEHEE